MGTIPEDKAAGDQLLASEANALRDIGYIADLNAGETINGATLPVAVYQNPSDNEVYACDGDDGATSEFIGFAISNSTDGNSIQVQNNGIVDGFSGLIEGTRYYVQDDKTIGIAKGTNTIYVGIALSETQLLIDKHNISIIDQLHNKFYLIGSELVDNSGGGTLVQNTDVMTITTAAAASSAYANNVETDAIDSTKDFDLLVRFNSSTAAQHAVIIGINGTIATLPNVNGEITTDHAAFVIGGSTLYSSTGDGTTQTKNTISGVTLDSYNNYRIRRKGSSIYFYVNGDLKFTHTTNLPDDTSVQLQFGVNNGDAGSGARTVSIMKNYIFVQ